MLPHVDDFLPVHNLESLTELAAALDVRTPRGRGATPAAIAAGCTEEHADGDDQHAQRARAAWRPSGRRSTTRRCSRRAFPGCESIEPDGENAYRIALAARSRARSRRNSPDGCSSPTSTPPTAYTLTFEGQGGAAGFAKGDAKVALAPAENGAATALSYTVKAQVGGKIAQIGSRLVDGAAQKLADDFFARFCRRAWRRRPGGGAAAAAGRRAAAPSAAGCATSRWRSSSA